MKYLVLTIRGPGFDVEVLPAHYAFLDRLRGEGQLEQAGAFTDGTGGAYVLSAPDLSAALLTAENDPLHLHNCSKVTVHEWNAR